MAIKLKPEPVWAKYITEDNLPTEDLKLLCEIIGLEATKKLMFNAAGDKCHSFLLSSYKNEKFFERSSLLCAKTLKHISLYNCSIS